MEALAQLPLAFQPGARWRYSMSIDMLGYLVELISGLPFECSLEGSLFKPLGMPDTAFYVPATKRTASPRCTGMRRTKRACSATTCRCRSSASYVATGGGCSPRWTISALCQMLVDGGELDGARILSPKTVAMFSQNQAPAEALPYGFAAGEDLYHAGYG